MARSAAYPDAKGRYGAFGGRYVPEMLVPALDACRRASTATCMTRNFKPSSTMN